MRLVEIALLGALFAFYIAAFYPGAIPPDALWMFHMIRGVSPVSNWHPPFITLLWNALDRVFHHPGPLYVVQTLLIFHAVALAARELAAGWRRIAVELLILTWPAVVGQVTALWKDSWFLAFLLYGTAGVLRHRRSHRSRDLVLALAGAAAAALTRPNGIFAALPLVVAVAASHAGARARAWRARAARASLLVVGWIGAVAAANAVITRSYVEVLYEPWELTLLHDMVAISIAHGRVELPPHLTRPPPTLAELEALYQPETADPLIFQQPGKYCFPFPLVPREHRFRVVAAWARAVAASPSVYLRHRAGFFRALVGLGPRAALAPYVWGITPNRFGWEFRPRGPTTWALSRLASVSTTPVFRAWIYVAALLLAAAGALLARRLRAVGVVAASALGTAVTNFFVLPTWDFRYMLWPVVAALLVIAGTAAALLRRDVPPGGAT
ncbi:MAG TPA: hypothetical protein VFP65_09410 [Anaeromyxobacteraceae bacterium]|nr:hypothetical protein [Anaeromyxobacteraceae bacterium]